MRKPKRKSAGKKVAKRTSKAKAVRRARPTRATATGAAAAGVLVVNIIPKSLSAETNQDSEPSITVNPANTEQIVASAFTPDPLDGGLAPYFVSQDGGRTWVLNTVMPGGSVTGDVSLTFSGSEGKLYGGILRNDAPNPPITRMALLRTDDFTSPTEMEVLNDREQPDQPFAQAVTVDGGKERLYVGNNDFAGAPGTATIDVLIDAGSGAPEVNSVRIEHRSTGDAGQDGPQVRTAVHPDGTVYGAFYGWRSQSGSFDANTLVVTADVVVVRDDQGGGGADPFIDLKDPIDAVIGQRVATGVSFAFDKHGKPVNGQQRLGGTLAIAVDPRAQQSGTVYLAWGSDESATGFTIHVRRSTDRGIIWSPADLLTLARATNASLAISTDGVVGLLYQQLSGAGANLRWETHLRRSSDDGVTWSDLILASTPANNPPNRPPNGFDPYLGDYDHMVAVGKDFYGIFSASNVPDRANFPSGVTYQRNADFTTRDLLDLDGRTQVGTSIDPFFFKVNG
jgi:hypothetical protein